MEEEKDVKKKVQVQDEMLDEASGGLHVLKPLKPGRQTGVNY